MAIGMPGVDEGKFNELYDGDEDIYKSVLETFVKTTPVTLTKLANPTQETLDNYRINVHAVKGACANICIEDLRQKALNLEMLAKAGDLAGVQGGNAAFIKEMEGLVEKANGWLKSHP